MRIGYHRRRLMDFAGGMRLSRERGADVSTDEAGEGPLTPARFVLSN